MGLGTAYTIAHRRGHATVPLDFGFTPDVYANNLALLKIDVGRVDALIISHGHYHHIGIDRIPEANRAEMRKSCVCIPRRK